MRNRQSTRHNRTRRIFEPAVRSGILAAPLILMLAIVVILSGAEPKLSAMIDQTFTGSISPIIK
ncbi:hypothetical protein CN878_07600 [Ochrobactrum sp. 695/2009]|nr:hypothetical protein CN881_02935 [Ochrobactrum sp. 721/2009]PJT17858.1 hypothetical protein CN880_04400 [Ochrobactrum sp. 720/2009]PJT21009.1 hypothetical protein CN879_16155 [Ochrobactrum sp. 715/2009]PJT31193.1 hypothetical protein CN878_07600 [Ochrobactrum sp. 695/2009]PJT33219.1 hypothetical protein CN877_17605 [Ochrobactrum sp. 689/2009]